MTARRARTYRIADHERGLGGHLCVRLEPFELPAAPTLERLQIWGTGGNRNVNEGEAGLQRALLLPSNRHILARMAGLPETLTPLFAAREVCDIDVIAVFAGCVLFVDCKRAGAKESPPQQLAQALRNALVARANVVIGPGDVQFGTRLVSLRGWDPGEPRPPRLLPVGCDWLRPADVGFWGFRPFRAMPAIDALFLDEWEVLDSDPRTRIPGRPQHVYYPTPSTRALHEGLELKLQTVGSIRRAHLRLAAAEHARALQDKRQSPVALLRAAAHANDDPPAGWRFEGELNEKGCVRLVWQASVESSDPDELVRWVNGRLLVRE